MLWKLVRVFVETETAPMKGTEKRVEQGYAMEKEIDETTLRLRLPSMTAILIYD